MKILIVSPVDTSAIKKLSEYHQVVCVFNADEETIQKLIRDCEALVFRSGVKNTAQFMESVTNLKLFIRAGSGLDNLLRM